MNQRSAPLQSLVWELRRAFRELAEAGDASLGSLSLSVGDRALLEFLAREGRPVSMAALARTYAVSRQHIHQSLRRSPLAGLIDEYADPEDRRSVLIALNAKGRALWRRVQAVDEAFFQNLAPAFDRDELHRGCELLRKLRAVLSAQKEMTHDRA